MIRIASILCLVSLITPAASHAGELEDAGRAILEKNKAAVITVQLVLKQKFSFGGQGSEENETKMEVTGSVIGADGLTVVSLSETDPSSRFTDMVPEHMMDQFTFSTELSDVKLILDDNSEIDAAIILRDKDLDLAFLRPKSKPETPLTHVDLSTPGTAQVLDNLVTITRLGKVANRIAGASFERIEGVVTKPRTFYVPSTAYSTTTSGCPAFTVDGKLVGVFVSRSIKDTSGAFASSGRGNQLAILLPVSDILDGVSQVPAFGEEPASTSTDAGDSPEVLPAE